MNVTWKQAQKTANMLLHWQKKNLTVCYCNDSWDKEQNMSHIKKPFYVKMETIAYESTYLKLMSI